MSSSKNLNCIIFRYSFFKDLILIKSSETPCLLINLSSADRSESAIFLIIFFGLLISIFWLPVLSQIGILSFIDTIGSFFGPLFGLIICDYYLIKKGKIINKDIFSSKVESSYFYSNGWHYKAIYSVITGFIFASSTIWNVNMQFLQTFSWLMGAFISFVTYYLLASK